RAVLQRALGAGLASHRLGDSSDPGGRADEPGRLFPSHHAVGDDRDVRADRGRRRCVRARTPAARAPGLAAARLWYTARTSKGASMVRFGVAFGLILSVRSDAVAFAQQPGQGPPMPMALDLAKVEAGSWAEYSMVMGQMPPLKTRMALVAKTPTTNVGETPVEGGMMAMAGGKMTMQMTLAPGPEGNIK